MKFNLHTCFQQYRKKYRKKYLCSSHVDGKREIACFHVETATGKRQKMAGKSWSRVYFLPFAFHVYAISNICASTFETTKLFLKIYQNTISCGWLVFRDIDVTMATKF